MTMPNGTDKRRHPRVDSNVRVRTTASDAPLTTLNLSAGGLFCTSPAWVAPMTRLALSLELPASNGDAATVIEGEAVVVRTEPEAPTPDPSTYRIALFFARMDDAHRRTLQNFLSSRSS
ncbi:MAG TPA: PilZ domain-containing protein [Candidatus Polarisedimenticolia bacterium]|nr:PilZ domain-containing protein [Candidatus Polarisedimenticolia bacterium]